MVGVPEQVRFVGVIRSSRKETGSTPVQTRLNAEELGTIVLDEEFAEGVDGLDGFDYAWLLTWLGRPSGRRPKRLPLRHVPFLLQRAPRKVGVFAARGPARPNPIGLSLVQVLSVEGAEIRFAGVDMLDGTPVLDIKPYVGAFDRPPGAPRCGWVDEVELPAGATRLSLRPPSG